ncbi:coiled-coil domain-containing protein 120 isoform X2 [Tachyglossus aculeatus]|uniref:coiled-coil domain-containing protein 120 isoform X2 n=1 Tax=Tachyglossus aculeatus TaxID=9261 RepID=UPI0018F4F653|nr:coiled-coil domain-containing protein 120 isoform X2 [Tachyglossus aculeatus]
MEVKGQLISSPTYSSPAPLQGNVSPKVKMERLRELLERQRGLQEALSLKLKELRKVCLQEAELTGQLPAEYPAEPGERPHLIRQRRPACPRLARAEEQQLEALEREVSVQQQIAAAARRLVLAPELSAEQRRRRRQVQADALRRLQELEEQLSQGRARLGPGTLAPAPTLGPGPRLIQLGQEDAVHSESSSLSESASHDNDEPHGFPSGKGGPPMEWPSPPKARDQLRAVSGGSPERRPGWRIPPNELCGDLRNRRNSVASPTSPTRTLPRSVSSFEGRSVPATPVLTRGAGPQLFRPEGLQGLHARQWSGSQDSQMGFPREGPWDRTALFAARTRRSNSSEALIDRGAGPPPAPAPPPPPFKSTEALHDRAFSSRTAGPPEPPRAARPSSAAPRGPRAPPAYGDPFSDYPQERGPGRSWGEPEGPGHLSRRDAPPLFYVDSPVLRSKENHSRVGRAKSCGPPEGPLPFWAAPGPAPPARFRGQPDHGERSAHKALALEGLRDWYIRNASAYPRGVLERRPPPGLYPGPRFYEPGPPELYGYGAIPPFPHSLSFTAPPLSGRHYADFLCAPEPSSRLSDLKLVDGERSPETDPNPPGTLV